MQTSDGISFLELPVLFYLNARFAFPAVRDVAVPAYDAGVDLCAKAGPPKPSDAPYSAAAAAQSLPPKDEPKKKKQEKKGTRKSKILPRLVYELMDLVF